MLVAAWLNNLTFIKIHMFTFSSLKSRWQFDLARFPAINVILCTFPPT